MISCYPCSSLYFVGIIFCCCCIFFSISNHIVDACFMLVRVQHTHTHKHIHFSPHHMHEKEYMKPKLNYESLKIYSKYVLNSCWYSEKRYHNGPNSNPIAKSLLVYPQRQEVFYITHIFRSESLTLSNGLS